MTFVLLFVDQKRCRRTQGTGCGAVAAAELQTRINSVSFLHEYDTRSRRFARDCRRSSFCLAERCTFLCTHRDSYHWFHHEG
ncbi:hypothetical protein M378DRAFT_649400 [Amanita muscaria Koide BX008]|uniref:Uncharacterized protein n=1 Tax=Amanita muscaria (strain Koide BX008) TaxID=946122 RepID=A0A0C2X4Y4_AMAMK|nr:hypothetical protein M378DRAFT_649400 [Amanita muscaria Koide BX008]